MPLTARCEAKLQGVHPDLAKVVRMASDRTKFRITEGLRSRERQTELVSSGKSRTMNSRHITGHAIDFIAIGADGIATYDDADMKRVAEVMRQCARECGVPIEWGAAARYGGDFKTFHDSPHIQLPWKEYPALGVSTTTRVLEAMKKPTVAAPSAAGGALAAPELAAMIPTPPDVSALTGWKSSLQIVHDFGAYLAANKLLALAALGIIAATFILPKLRGSS